MKQITGSQFARILEIKGWELKRLKGSHHIQISAFKSLSPLPPRLLHHLAVKRITMVDFNKSMHVLHERPVLENKEYTADHSDKIRSDIR